MDMNDGAQASQLCQIILQLLLTCMIDGHMPLSLARQNY